MLALHPSAAAQFTRHTRLTSWTTADGIGLLAIDPVDCPPSDYLDRRPAAEDPPSGPASPNQHVASHVPEKEISLDFVLRCCSLVSYQRACVIGGCLATCPAGAFHHRWTFNGALIISLPLPLWRATTKRHNTARRRTRLVGHSLATAPESAASLLERDSAY